MRLCNVPAGSSVYCGLEMVFLQKYRKEEMSAQFPTLFARGSSFHHYDSSFGVEVFFFMKKKHVIW